MKFWKRVIVIFICVSVNASLSGPVKAVGAGRDCLNLQPVKRVHPKSSGKGDGDLVIFQADPLMLEVRMHKSDNVFSIFAVPGEFEPLVLGFAASRPLGEVSIRIGDLRLDDGNIFPASLINVRVARVMTIPVDSRPMVFGRKKCRRQPFVLLPGRSMELGPEEPAWFWFTFEVPRNSRPGLYSGSIQLFSGEDEIAKWPIAITVHSFSLETPPIEYVMLYETSLTELAGAKTESSRSEVLELAEAIYRDLYDHGMTAVSPVEGPHFERNADGLPDFTVTRIALDLARKHGLIGMPVINIAPLARTEKKKHPWNHAEHRPDLHPGRVTEYVKAVVQWGRTAGWEGIAFSPIDEPDIPERTRIGKEVLKATKEVKGAITFLAGTPRQIAPLSDWVDIANLQSSRYTSRDSENLKRDGKRVWIYDNWIVLGTTPIETRFVTGLYAWQAGLEGVTAWTYPLTSQRAVDWETGWRPPVIGEDGRPVTTTVWEAFREGVDDGRYAYTLVRLIDRARKAGIESDSVAAEAVLRRVSERIRPAVQWYASGKKEGRRMGGLEPEDLHWSRKQLAEAIHTLSGKLASNSHVP